MSLVTSSAAVAAKHTPQVEHWSAHAHLLLAQCLVAEADEATSDWTAIAFTMKNWLGVRQRIKPSLRYTDVVKGMCSVHKLKRQSLTNRQLWIRGLTWPHGTIDGVRLYAKPEHFPARASWKRKQRYWDNALSHAHRWQQGSMKDPCKGKAVIWGAPRDPDNKWHIIADDPITRGLPVVRLACSNHLSNDYYRMMTKTERAEHKKEQTATD